MPTSPSTDKAFAGSIPKIYQTYLVPLIFQAYADDLARRLVSTAAGRVLEIAAGTGVATRALAAALPGAEIVATDLNQAMLDEAATLGTPGGVVWRQADATALPFSDGAFDAVVCQFGVMFFPDKAKAYAEARRVLRTGGVFLFNAWDRIEDNGFADAVTSGLHEVFPDDPPRFLARTPHGYHDKAAIAGDLSHAGFRAAPEIVTIAERSRADSARIPALAFCQGTPLRHEIETRDARRLAEATDAAEREVGRRYGNGAVEARMQAHVVTVAP